MTLKNIAIGLGILAFCVVVLSLVIISIQNGQMQLDERMKVFESKLPETVLVQNAIESGWSNDYQIKDETVFLFTLKLYGITEVWRTRYGDMCKYSFVFDSVVYYFYVE